MSVFNKINFSFFFIFISYSIIYGQVNKKEKVTEKSWQTIVNSTSNFDSLLHQEIYDFQNLVEASFVVRAGMTKIIEKINTENDGPISSSNINYLRSKTQNCLQLRDDLFEVTNKYRFALDNKKKENKNSSISDLNQTKAIMLSLSSALTLYDNYILGALLLEKDDRLRKFLNETDQGFGITKNQLLEITLSANSIENQKIIKKGIDFYEEKLELYKNFMDDDYQYLVELINTSPSYNYLKNISGFKMGQKKFEMLANITSDLLNKASSKSSNSISKFFGNSIGVIEMRKGKLYNDSIAYEKLKSNLQPLDILLEKTPFRLTDKFIPGHFGHVAIWVGTKEELIEKGLWENELIKPYQSLINSDSTENSKDGKQIVEALRSGVQLSSLHDFLNVDDVVILRPLFIAETPEIEQESILLTFRQLGKEYDFNFDVNTTEKIVCSELAYICFPTVDWETKKLAGRYTISPDNVAQLCINGKFFELILFYHDGKDCSTEDKLELLKKLTTIEKI